MDAAMPPSYFSTTSKHGFTAIPRALFDRLLTLDLTKREMMVLLLIVRLTYGVRNTSWVSLRQADLIAVGISGSHAKATLAALLKRGVVTYDPDRKAYQVARGLISDADRSEPSELQRAVYLARLVAQQLTLTAASSDRSAPTTGGPILPKREEHTVRNGKNTVANSSQFSRTRQGFVRAIELLKDKERQI